MPLPSGFFRAIGGARRAAGSTPSSRNSGAPESDWLPTIFVDTSTYDPNTGRASEFGFFAVHSEKLVTSLIRAALSH